MKTGINMSSSGDSPRNLLSLERVKLKVFEKYITKTHVPILTTPTDRIFHLGNSRPRSPKTE